MEINPLSPNIGAEIYGLNLRDNQSEDLKAQITALLGRHEVLFFKGQPSLTPKEYLQVAEFLGQPMHHPFISKQAPVVPGISPFQPYESIPEITGIYHDEKSRGNLNEWHSDLNWLTSPSSASVLRCLIRPTSGGDTVWASMHAAYKGLPPSFREHLQKLSAEHDFTQIYRGAFANAPEQLKAMQRLYPACVHPVVATHPIYKKLALFVNRVSTTKIVGLAEDESKALLEQIYTLAKTPEYQCRYRWESGDIAIWDNVLTQHYAVSDYFPQPRKMERISLAGQPLEFQDA